MAPPISLLTFCLLSSIFAWSASWALGARAAQKQHTHNPVSCGCDAETIDDVTLWLDMIFIVDSSDDVDEKDFSSIKTLLSSLSTFIAPQETSDKHSRIAIINTAHTAETFADLEKYTTPTQMEADVMTNLKQRGGKFNMTAGLVAARDMVSFEDAQGTRKSVKRAVVVFSTTTWNCTGSSMKASDNKGVCQLFNQLESETSTLIAIGLKVNQQQDYPFIDIPDKCNYVTSERAWVKDLLTVLCFANCYCKKSGGSQFRIPSQCLKYAECIVPDDFSLSYAAALETCVELESDNLATVRSEEQDNFLYGLQSGMQYTPYWIGLNYTNGKLYYSDGTRLASDDYVNWCTSSNQPSSAGACVYEDKCGDGIGWFTSKCGHFIPTYYYACQNTACTVSRFCSE